ncbi:putative bifunctional diguanylate cyclase/phosphodiesterase [Sphingobium yanoikuyae]|uniref:EAL domain-containing protein n=1 Tax=Sphingobium yanoikuyae TaxID=13690 RepID=A0A430BM71_SPHYA|nr:EAL domain-containing protein [Sphingobium yanoikuyae]RSU53815.1 EAL domain-containing protein [Sphingobium yanoikuyae]
MIALSRISGEFHSPEREAAFQADRLPESRRHAHLLFALSALLNTLFLLSDWRFAGTAHFWVAVPARLVVVFWSLVSLGLCRYMHSFKAVERICFVWQCVTAIGVAFLVSSRSDIAIFVLVMLPLVFYLVVPTSFRGNVGGGLGCGVALLIGYLAPAPLSPTMPGMIMAVLMLHCGMWIAIARTNRLQRMEWTASQDAQAARVALAANGEALERLFMTVPLPLIVIRDDGTVLRMNDSAARNLGTADDVARLALIVDHAPPLRLLDRLTRGDSIDNDECCLANDEGIIRDVLLGARPILLAGEQCILASIVDITDRKQAERHLAHLAMTDALTGLANRSHFMASLMQAAQSTERSGGQMAVVLIDVDEFKRINDSAGHDAGDALLCAVAERLRDSVRPADMIARMGGDEFAVILTRLRGLADLDTILSRMIARLHMPLRHGGRDIDCRVSMGVALYPDHAGDMIDLMKHADIALYEAKNSGRGRACLFEPGLLESWQTEARMLERARDALAHAQPVPWYQPKVDLQDGRVIGFEALLRCVRPDGTLMMPDQILAAFEHPELGRKITERMIDQVLADCRAWISAGIDFGHVAVNVPGVELHDRAFPDRLLARLAHADVEPRRIELEVTESVFLGRNVDVVERNLQRLSQAGMAIALDDFGTGYASLSHLKQFPIDVIKIDKGFVRDLETDPDDAAIVRTVLNLAYSLGVKTVAEGVETIEQLEYLRSGGCHYGQGYYWSAAVPASQLPSFLEPSRFARRS